MDQARQADDGDADAGEQGQQEPQVDAGDGLLQVHGGKKAKGLGIDGLDGVEKRFVNAGDQRDGPPGHPGDDVGRSHAKALEGQPEGLAEGFGSGAGANRVFPGCGACIFHGRVSLK